MESKTYGATRKLLLIKALKLKNTFGIHDER